MSIIMSNILVKPLEDGSYSLTVAGYVLIGVIIFAALVLIARIGNHGRKTGAKQIAFSAAAIALATVTSMIQFWKMPMGGGVTLFSMLFIVLIGYWYGPTVGISAGIAYGLLQFVLDPYIVSLPQVLFDYVFAFGALGISGFFSRKKHGLLIGYIVGITGRFVFSFLSGVIFFGIYASDTLAQFGIHVGAAAAPFVYSALYNGAYIYAEGAITIVLLCIPPVAAALRQVKAQATT